MELSPASFPVTLLVIPCVLALALKILLAWYNWQYIKRSNVLIVLFIATLFGLNFGELLLFLFAHHPESIFALIGLKWVYVFAILMSQCFLLLSLDIAGRLTKTVFYVAAVVTIVGALEIVLPVGVLDGVESIGYSLTRIPGDQYWMFQLIFLGGVLVGFVALIHTVTSDKLGRGALQKRKAKALLIGTMPIILVSFVVAVLMQLGFAVNYSVVGTFAIIFLLWVLIIVEHKENLYGFLGKVPTTSEYNLSIKLNRAIANFDLEKIQRLTEEALIPEAISRCNGNLTHAAKLLGVSRNTLSRRIAQFEEREAQLNPHPSLKD